MDLKKIFQVSASGMNVQSERLKVVAENIANADSLAKTPGGMPYRRKLITFESELDRAAEVETVRVDRIRRDPSDLGTRFDPNHPGANEDGYVLTPNVNPLIELMDMREAQKTYEANLNVLDTTRTMLQRTIQILQ
ncbi:MAG TPA: flagellar basal body rod protein FlgC [Alphaproteobacteria bacterium]